MDRNYRRDEIDAAIEFASKKLRIKSKCRIRFQWTKNHSSVATATYSKKWQQGEIEFSTAYKDLSWEEFRETIIHEVCHIYEFMIYGRCGHRQNFKDAMTKCGYPNAKRTM